MLLLGHFLFRYFSGKCYHVAPETYLLSAWLPAVCEAGILLQVKMFVANVRRLLRRGIAFHILASVVLSLVPGVS